jgi:hypothetical protein
LSRLVRQSERFLGTIAWFFARTARQQPARFLALVAASGTGLVALSAGFGAVYAILTALERGSAIELAGFSFDPSRRELLYLAAGFAAATVALGAWLVYLARHQAVVASAELLRHMAAELTTLNAPVLEPSAYLSDARLRSALARHATSNARRCALALQRGLDVPVPLLVVAAGLAVLFLLEPRAAGASLVMASTVVPIMYLVNLRGVRASKRYEASVGPARSDVLASIAASADVDPLEPGAAAAVGSPVLDHASASFRDRFLASLRADLASQLLTAAITFALLVYLVTHVLDGRLGLVELGTFMLVLRLVLGATRNVFVGIATISRHYPFLYGYRSLVGDDRPRGEPASVRMRAAPNALHEPGAELPDALPARGAWSVSARVTPSRHTAGVFALALAGGDPERARSNRAVLRVGDAHGSRPGDGSAGEGGDQRALHLIDARALEPEALAARASAGAPALLVRPGKPAKELGDTLHLVLSPDGRVLAWGRVAWVRERWDEIEALRERDGARFGEQPVADLEDDEG